jgi:hypothetical protein
LIAGTAGEHVGTVDHASVDHASDHASGVPMSAPHADDHGHSTAAWVTVAIISVGTVVSAIAFPLTSATLFWVGVGVIVAGVVVGYLWSRSSGDTALPVYTETTPEATTVEGPTRSADGTNRT